MHPKTGGKMFVLHILFASLVVLQGMVQNPEVKEVFVVKGNNVSIKCPWEGTTDQIYAITWYIRRNEFYRYIPSENPEKQIFSVPDHINLDPYRSINGQLILTNVKPDVAGNYSCEVVSTPEFRAMRYQFKLKVVENATLLPPRTSPSPVVLTTPPVVPTPPPVVSFNLRESVSRGRTLAATFPKTLSSPDCPKLYTRVGDKCISFFYLIKIGWGEAKVFCDFIGGELISFSKGHDDFLTLQKYMRESGMTADFWIGGRNANNRDKWTWLDGTSMELGSPYWAVRYDGSCKRRYPDQDSLAQNYWYSEISSCFSYNQAPQGHEHKACAAMDFLHYYSILDQDCNAKRSPICLLKEN